MYQPDFYLPDFDSRKFHGVVLYAAHRARQENDRWFGAVKLNKILYYSDFIAFRRLGRSITGANYQKLSEGPAPREMLRERQRLLNAELVRIVPVPVFNYVQHRIIPTAEDIDPHQYLDPEEVSIVDEVIDTFAGMSGAEVSGLSHRELGWRVAARGERIPYESAWLSPLPVDAEVEWLSAADSPNG